MHEFEETVDTLYRQCLLKALTRDEVGRASPNETSWQSRNPAWCRIGDERQFCFHRKVTQLKSR